MAETIEASLVSVLDQLDERFEVIVVDDGSTDNSVKVLRCLAERYTYPRFRLVLLKRDGHRKLGETRNISIREAQGEYVIPQVDCDDVYGPFIVDFVEAFHQIERCLQRDVYVKGRKINIAKRELLLRFGPYRNIFRGEDRDMWLRLAAHDAIVPIVHRSICTRLPKGGVESLRRAIFHTFDQLQNEFRGGTSLVTYYRSIWLRKKKLSVRVRGLRSLMAPFAWFISLNKEPLPLPSNMSNEGFKRYWAQKSGTLGEILKRHNCEPDYSKLSIAGQEVFK